MAMIFEEKNWGKSLAEYSKAEYVRSLGEFVQGSQTATKSKTSFSGLSDR
jgi:hypothetical protein